MAVVHLSPELPRLTVRGHEREPSDPVDMLSASYPSPALRHVSDLADDSPGQLQRSYSGRPRSQSTFQDISSKQRKSLRGLGRSRGASVASAWISGKVRQAGGDGGSGNRRASASDAESATTEQIDSAFRKIKEQLAVLSEEDQVLKERVERLSEEINILNTPVKQMQSNHQSTSVLVSPSWKTASQFSMSISESDYPSMRQTKNSLPTLVVSRNDSVRAQAQELTIHETIAEQTGESEEEGEREERVTVSRRRPISRASPVGYRGTMTTKTNGASLASGTLSLDPVPTNQKFTFHYTISQ